MFIGGLSLSSCTVMSETPRATLLSNDTPTIRGLFSTAGTGLQLNSESCTSLSGGAPFRRIVR